MTLTVIFQTVVIFSLCDLLCKNEQWWRKTVFTDMFLIVWSLFHKSFRSTFFFLRAHAWDSHHMLNRYSWTSLKEISICRAFFTLLAKFSDLDNQIPLRNHLRGKSNKSRFFKVIIRDSFHHNFYGRANVALKILTGTDYLVGYKMCIFSLSLALIIYPLLEVTGGWLHVPWHQKLGVARFPDQLDGIRCKCLCSRQLSRGYLNIQ